MMYQNCKRGAGRPNYCQHCDAGNELNRVKSCIGACAQTQQGVVFSAYEVKVDRMTVLRGNTTEQTQLRALAAATATANVTSVVAFRSVDQPVEFSHVKNVHSNF